MLCLASNALAARFPIDQFEFDRMRLENPQGASDLEEGERLAATGKLEAALEQFRRAGVALPNASLPVRRQCEALTALGRGPEATPLCYRAFSILRTNVGLRAIVRSLVTGPAAPTIAQVGEALALTTFERQKSSGQMLLASAMCDIAERIGDGVMLQRCGEELVRLAPQASETREVLARLDARCPPYRFWFGWLTVAAIALATLIQSLRARPGPISRRASATVVTSVVLCMMAFGWAREARAEEVPEAGAWLTSLPISDNDPEGTIPSEADRSKDPIQFGYWLQDVALKGALASKHGDHAAAAKFYRALAKAVPDRAISYRKLCDEYEALGEREKAIAACGAALLPEGVTLGDYARYVHMVLAKPGRLTSDDTKTLDGILANLTSDPNAHPLVDELECEVGARTSNVAQLRECTQALAAKSIDPRKTIAYEWALAMAEGDVQEARQLAVRAKEVGVSEGALKGMESAMSAATSHSATNIALSVAAVVLLLAAAGLGGRALWRRRAAMPQAA